MNIEKTEVFLEEWKRMCDTVGFCEDCDMKNIDTKTGVVFTSKALCILGVLRNAKNAIFTVQNWSDEHPVPKQKTYADVFFEQHPKAAKRYLSQKDYDIGNAFPSAKRCDVYGIGIGGCLEGTCTYEAQMKCWNEPYPEQEE